MIQNEYKITVLSVFGRGGAMRDVVRTQEGKQLELKMVPMKSAHELVALLG